MLDDIHYQMKWFERARKSIWVTWFVILYVAGVLAVDTLATWNVSWLIRWAMFDWDADDIRNILSGIGLPRTSLPWLHSGPMQQFDWFKFITWFLIPFLCSWPWLVRSAFSFRGWKKWDIALLVVVAIGGMGAMGFILIFPDLRNIYPGREGLSPDEKWGLLLGQLVWVASWLPGWEFMHRYVLLDRVSITWPWFGWLMIPLFEVVYHLQKPGMETLAMLIFSVFLTRWAMWRANVMLPFLAHLLVEVDLILFMLMTK